MIVDPLSLVKLSSSKANKNLNTFEPYIRYMKKLKVLQKNKEKICEYQRIGILKHQKIPLEELKGLQEEYPDNFDYI